MAIEVFPIPAFSDNYIWCLHNQQQAVVVDPGDAEPVLAYCKNQGLRLTGILITHHHWDHTNGIDDLLKAFPNIRVYGPQNPNISQITHRLSEPDTISLPDLALEFKVLEVPGHTLDHIAYYGEIGLFCGDTLLSAGCGRLFEGTAKQMHQSLAKLTALPAQTAVYCTHEYTLANINFAQQVEPNNKALQDYKSWAISQRNNQRPTLPSSIQKELSINPFVRCNTASVMTSVNKQAANYCTEASEVFASLRSWKDNF
ncbi:hydroxyacylglutathione hydrolase [Paraglaciecola aestuariivivens]